MRSRRWKLGTVLLSFVLAVSMSIPPTALAEMAAPPAEPQGQQDETSDGTPSDPDGGTDGPSITVEPTAPEGDAEGPSIDIAPADPEGGPSITVGPADTASGGDATSDDAATQDAADPSATPELLSASPDTQTEDAAPASEESHGLYFGPENRDATNPWNLFTDDNLRVPYERNKGAWRVEDHTLFLNGFHNVVTESWCGLRIFNFGPVEIVLEAGSENSIDASHGGFDEGLNELDGSFGIYSEAHLTIGGEGSLSVKSANVSHRVGAYDSSGVYARSGLTVQGSSITAEAGERVTGISTGLRVENGLSLKDATIKAEGFETEGVDPARKGSYGLYVQGATTLEKTSNECGIDARGYDAGVFLASEPQFAGGDKLLKGGREHNDPITRPVVFDAGRKTYRLDDGATAKHVYLGVTNNKQGTLYYAEKNGTPGLYVDASLQTPYTEGRGTTWDFDSSGDLRLNGFEYVTEAEVAIMFLDPASIFLEDQTSRVTSLAKSAHRTAGLYAKKSLEITGTGSLVATGGSLLSSGEASGEGDPSVETAGIACDEELKILNSVHASGGDGVHSYGIRAKSLVRHSNSAGELVAEGEIAGLLVNEVDVGDLSAWGCVLRDGAELLPATFSPAESRYKVDGDKNARYVVLNRKALASTPLYFGPQNGNPANDWSLYTDDRFSVPYTDNTATWSVAPGTRELRLSNFFYATSAPVGLQVWEGAADDVSIKLDEATDSFITATGASSDAYGINAPRRNLTVSGFGVLTVSVGSGSAPGVAWGVRAKALNLADDATLYCSSHNGTDSWGVHVTDDGSITDGMLYAEGATGAVWAGRAAFAPYDLHAMGLEKREDVGVKDPTAVTYNPTYNYYQVGSGVGKPKAQYVELGTDVFKGSLYFAPKDRANVGGAWTLYTDAAFTTEYPASERWEAEGSKLTLVGFTYRSDDPVALYVYDAAAQIELIDRNTLTGSADGLSDSAAVKATAPLVISGASGSLSARATTGSNEGKPSVGIDAGQLVIKQATVEARGGSRAAGAPSYGVKAFSVALEQGASLDAAGGATSDSQSFGVHASLTTEGTGGTVNVSDATLKAAGDTGAVYAEGGSQTGGLKVKGSVERASDELQDAAYDANTKFYQVGSNVARQLRIYDEMGSTTLYLGPKDGNEANAWSLFVDEGYSQPYTAQSGHWSVEGRTLKLNGFTQRSSAPAVLEVFATIHPVGLEVQGDNVLSGSGHADASGGRTGIHSNAAHLTISGTGTLDVSAATSGGANAESSAIVARDLIVEGERLKLQAAGGESLHGTSYGIHAKRFTMNDGELRATGDTAGVYSEQEPAVATLIVTGNVDRYNTNNLKSASYGFGSKCYEVDGKRAGLVRIAASTDGTLYFGPRAGAFDAPWSLYSNEAMTIPYVGNEGAWKVNDKTLELTNFNYVANASVALVVAEDNYAKIKVKGGTSTIASQMGQVTGSSFGIDVRGWLGIEGDGVLNVRASKSATEESAGMRVRNALVTRGATLNAVAGAGQEASTGIIVGGSIRMESGTVVATGDALTESSAGVVCDELEIRPPSALTAVGTDIGAKTRKSQANPMKDGLEATGSPTRTGEDAAAATWGGTYFVTTNETPCRFVSVAPPGNGTLYFGPQGKNPSAEWSLFTDYSHLVKYVGQQGTWRVEGHTLILNGFKYQTEHTEALRIAQANDAAIVLEPGSESSVKSTASGEGSTYGIVTDGALSVSGQGALTATAGSPSFGKDSNGVKAALLKVSDTTLIGVGGTGGVSAFAEPDRGSLLVRGTTNRAGTGMREVLWDSGRYYADGLIAEYVKFASTDPYGTLYFGPQGNVAGNEWSLFIDSTMTKKHEGEGRTWYVEGKDLRLMDFFYHTDGLVGLVVKSDPAAAITAVSGTHNTIECEAWMDTSASTVVAVRAEGALAVRGEGELNVTAQGAPTTGPRYGLEAASLQVTAGSFTAVGGTAGLRANAEPTHPNTLVRGSQDRYGSNLKPVAWATDRYLVDGKAALCVDFESNPIDGTLYFGAGDSDAEWSLYQDQAMTQEYPGKDVTWRAAGHTLTLMGLQYETKAATALRVEPAADAALFLAPDSVSSFKSMSDGEVATYGVYAAGALSINGSGTLLAAGGDATDGGVSAGLFMMGILTVGGGQLSLESGAGGISTGLSALLGGTIKGGIVDAKGNTGGARSFSEHGLTLEGGVAVEGAVNRDDEALKPAVFDEPSSYYRVDGQNARHTRFAAPPNPAIVADPSLIDFGAQATGTTSAEQVVNVTATDLLADMAIEAPAGFTVTPAQGWDPRFGGQLRVTFSPTETRPYGDLVFIRSEGAPSEAVAVEGYGIESAIEVDPGILSFGYQAVATKSAEKRVRVQASNLAGDLEIEVPAGFTAVPAEGWNARTGGEMRVTFDPTEAKTYGGILWFRAKGLTKDVSAQVAVNGEGRTSAVTASTGHLAFGRQPVATKSAEQRVRISAVGLEGDMGFDVPEGFTVTPAEDWNARTGGELRITFDPTEAKPYGAVLMIGADGTDAASVALTGEGREVAVAADPGLLAFGMQGVGTESETMTITVSASGLTSNMAYDAPEGFKVVPGDNWDPRRGGQLYVTFAPTEAASYAGILWIGADGADAAPVALTGEGVKVSIKVSPQRLDFGDQTVNTKSVEKRVTVKAVGLSDGMTFETPEGFEIKPADNWNPLTGGELRVTFSPTSEKMYDGVLSIVSGTAKATPIALEGTGTTPTIVILPVFNDFGTQPIGTESAEQRIHVSAYNAQADLEIAVPAGFKVMKAANWNARTGGDLIAKFAPTEAKSYYEELKVGSQGSWSTAFLTGQGRQSIIRLTPEKVDFGTQAVGTRSGARIVEVAASDLAADMTFNVPEGFTVEPAPGWNARTGGKLRVTFEPAKAANYHGILSVKAGSAAGTASLSGEGKVSSIAATPGKLAFGPQPVATKSAEQLVSVKAVALGEDMTWTVPDGFTVTPADNWNARTGGDVRVTFDPTEAKAYRGVLRIEAEGLAATVALSGEGRAAMIAATPDHVDFGSQAVATKSVERDVVVTASGLTGDLTVDEPAGFTVVTAEGWNARTGGTLRVTFDPTEAKAYAGHVRISADGADEALVAVSGEGRTATITVAPERLAFGSQAVGTKSSEKLVQVDAVGLTDDLELSTLTGFTATPGADWNARTGGTLRVTFDPTDEKHYTELLQIDADGADAATVVLDGTGTRSSIKVDPQTVAFGAQQVGTKSAERVVEVRGTNLAQDMSFTAPDGYTVVPDAGFNAKTGGKLHITFDPAEERSYGAVMWIEADGADAEPLTLTGEGVVPDIEASPKLLSFGVQPLATKSAEQLVEVKANDLAEDMRIIEPDEGFTVTPAEGWSPRTGGTLRVTFDPTEEKDYGQTLRIESDGADGASVSLTGTGRAAAIAASRGLVAFGKQPVGHESASLEVEVTASGLTQDMRFADVPAGFMVATADGWDARTGGTLRISFSPAEFKPYSGVMQIESDGVDAVPIVLTGEGCANIIAVDRGLLSFGYVEAGQESAAMTVKVKADLPATSSLAFTAPAGFKVEKGAGWDDRAGGELQIKFAPDQARVYGEVMWISADGADSVPVTLTGQGFRSTVTATPERLSFGSQLVGTKSAEQLVKIEASDGPGSLAYTVPDGFTVTPHEDWDPNAGGHLRVTFDPTLEKEYADFLRVQRGGAEACAVALGGTGCAAKIDVAPTQLDFGKQAVGSKSFERLIEVRATNVESDISYSDLIGTGFTVQPAVDDWNARTGGTLRVTFDPLAEKAYGSVLEISADGADAVAVPLRGMGVTQSVEVSPGLVAFGFQTIGTVSAEQRVEVRGHNLGEDITYNEPDGYVVTPADGWDGRQGGTLRVAFNPTEKKPYGAVMWVDAGDGVDAAPVVLTGEGRMANIEVTPARLDFAKQAVATKSVEQLVKVTAYALEDDLVVDMPEGFTATPAAGWSAREGGTLRVTFDPTEAKLYGGVMEVSADGADAKSVTLTGRGVAASIGASPGLVAFGFQPVGTKSAERTVRVEAHGLTGDMTYSAPQGFTVTPADNWNARTGGTLRVTFDPTEAKAYGAVMWIEANGADSAPVTFTGEGRDLSIKAVPGHLSFGNQAVGTKSAEQRIRVSASGLTDDLSFAAPDGFTVTPDEGWNARTGGELRVTFDPTEAKSYGAVMRIEANGADGAAVSLAGTGRASAIEAAPDLVAFGYQPLGTKSAEQLVEVRATGLEHDMAFTAPAGFTVVPAEGWDPLAGGTLRVTFDPTEARTYGEVMWIEAEGADGVPVTLTGEGRATAIKAAPDFLAFGYQPVGTKSVEQRVRVAASGLTGDMSFQAPEGFTVTPAEGWDVRQGGELRITFDPAEAKVYGDLLRIEADGTDAVYVALTGEGRDAAVKAVPGQLLFDAQVTGTKSAEQRVQVAAAGLTSDMAFDVPAGFTVVPAEGWNARTGGELRVTFDPTEVKSYAAPLWIRSDGSDGAAVALIGEGIASEIAVSRDLVAFGFQPVGTKSAEERVRVTAAGLTNDLAFQAPEGFTVTPAEGWNPRTGGELRITFDPTEAKDYGAVMWIGADGADAAPIVLAGEGRESAVKATPPALAFGDQPVGTKSAEQRVQVAASGLTGDMSFQAPEGFTVTPAEGWDPRAGGTLRVTFDPAEAKEYGAVLSIEAEGADAASVVLTGEGREQAIAVDPGLVAFGFQPVATKSAEQRVKVAASGLTSDMAFVEPDGFTVVPAEGWDPRTGGELRVTFDPTEAKSYGEVMWIESDGADAAPVALTGEGRDMAVKTSEGLLAFGSQPVATKSVEKQVRVEASGLQSDLAFSAPAGFTVTPAEGWDSRTGGTLRVTFDPTEPKSYGAVMWIESDGADAAPVALTGEGRDLMIAATPKSLAFGKQEVGTESAAQTVEVAASGLEGEMTLTAPEGFTVTPDQGWSAYTGGRLKVTFNPAEAKAYGGVLWIESEGTDAVAVALTGEGVKPAPPVPPKPKPVPPTPTPKPPTPITGDSLPVAGLAAVALLAAVIAGASWLHRKRKGSW
ncbi:choice-of-anchor D domain-containing protein [Arabiibacter massiliensis]|uniref:choice-of-anchor D domain-containing protein n=1 Tax=Arabiibacter massiliensis TaxID=1870985 RepID=UPI0009BAC188|nr:choice-of-anchor D domain-containing protein [Arabiibacter massiliensis]